VSLTLFNGVVANTPTTASDKIKVSVPDLTIETRNVYGPLAFVPNPDADAGITLPQAGDRAVISVDEESGEQYVIFWHRADTGGT
jgi:nitrous oxidase accessory protein NosD